MTTIYSQTPITLLYFEHYSKEYQQYKGIDIMFVTGEGSVDHPIISSLLVIEEIDKVIKYKFPKLYKGEHSKFKIFLI